MSREEDQNRRYGGAKGTVMELRSGTLAVLMGAAVLLTGCASTRSATGDEPGNRGDVRSEGGGYVIDGRALQDGPGSIVAALNHKVPNFRLHQTPGTTTDCPVISLRNAVSFQSVVNPHVYVDGIRTTDTCVLRQLRTHDVARVEVYPMGVTRRPGYGTHAHGLILVFMRSAGA